MCRLINGNNCVKQNCWCSLKFLIPTWQKIFRVVLTGECEDCWPNRFRHASEERSTPGQMSPEVPYRAHKRTNVLNIFSKNKARRVLSKFNLFKCAKGTRINYFVKTTCSQFAHRQTDRLKLLYYLSANADGKNGSSQWLQDTNQPSTTLNKWQRDTSHYNHSLHILSMCRFQLQSICRCHGALKSIVCFRYRSKCQVVGCISLWIQT